MKTQLKDRVLWYDGVSEVDPSLISEFLLSGVAIDKIAITHTDPDVEKYNSMADDPIVIGKEANGQIRHQYQIPIKYQTTDIVLYSLDKIGDLIKFDPTFTEELRRVYVARVEAELAEIKKNNTEYLFKTIIYIVDKLKETNTVWGVGRGSSCASLILFLIGIHKVNPIKYNIPMTEFFHD